MPPRVSAPSLLLSRLYRHVGTPRVYADLGEAAYGTKGRWAVMIIGYTYLAGTLISFHLTAAISLKEFLGGVGVSSPCQLTCSLVVAALMLALMQIRSLHELSWTAIVGVISIAVPLLIVAARLLEHPSVNDAAISNITNTPVMFPADLGVVDGGAALMNIVFAFAGQVIFVELMHEMKEPEDFPRAVYSSTTVMVGVYLFIASVGYACVGSLVKSPITSSLPKQDNVYLAIVNGFLFVHVIMGYALNANVMNTAVLARISAQAHDDNSFGTKLLWLGVTLGTLTTCFVVSSMIPFLNDLMGFVGASCGMATTYIFPCAFGLKLLAPHMSTAEKITQMALLVLAGCVSGFGVYCTVADMAQKLADGTGAPFSC